jgi:uroporphyrin-III C-methyltransferase/precorrin-2 dehydrogenase/sirohydrochlorin ferrochelatase
MSYFPAFLDLDGRSCLLVGGGQTAARKLRRLLKAGAKVTVVAPEVEGEIEALAATGNITLHRRPFSADDVSGRTVVQSATGREAVDRRVADAARAAGIQVNVVDRPELCSFIAPAVVDRDPVVIGISTGGAAPVLARRVRESIERLLPARLGRLARFAESFRGAVAATLPEGRARLRFWEGFFDGPSAGQVLRGEDVAAREAMLKLVNRPAPAAERGQVAIVGAGPGDPDLLTLGALRLLQRADAVVYDKLVGPEIVGYARRDAERIYVGKSKANHTLSQDQINALLVRLAEDGKRVVRLKGGDPFVFGRGGEELDHLKHHGVAVEVVPGITAAVGCAGSLGIPLTLRGVSQAVTLVTGHGQDGEPDLDWAALARLDQTLAIYMGVSTAGQVARRLIEHGLAASTPVAVIENGTLPEEKTVTGTLAELENLVRTSEITGPALIIVGEVVCQADGAVLPDLARAVAV